MAQPLIYTLLVIALVLPVPGAILLRLVAHRVEERWLIGAAATLFGLAIGGVLLLSQANVGALRVGGLTLMLSSSRPGSELVVPPDLAPVEGEPLIEPPSPIIPPTLTPRPSATATLPPTNTPVPSATSATEATATPELTATSEPTATAEPTATPEPTPTLAATAAPAPTSAPPAAAPQRYTVQAGDTFRAIAERFNVSVADLLRVNNLTPAEADALRVGQELIIP